MDSPTTSPASPAATPAVAAASTATPSESSASEVSEDEVAACGAQAGYCRTGCCGAASSGEAAGIAGQKRARAQVRVLRIADMYQVKRVR